MSREVVKDILEGKAGWNFNDDLVSKDAEGVLQEIGDWLSAAPRMGLFDKEIMQSISRRFLAAEKRGYDRAVKACLDESEVQNKRGLVNIAKAWTMTAYWLKDRASEGDGK